MATVCNLDYEGLSAKFDYRYKDTINERYTIQFDTAQTSPIAVMDTATVTSPDPIPLRGQNYPGYIMYRAKTFSIVPAANSRKLWHITVGYGALEEGEDDKQMGDNPLLRPPILNVEYMETEYVVDIARNVEELAHGDGKGGERAPFTEGPITNAAGVIPDEPIVDTERNAVLSITRNFATLGEIVDLNADYKKTTNSDRAGMFEPRTLKYMLTESLGMQTENMYTFWPGTTRIEVKKTTDLVFRNVGYQYRTSVDGSWILKRAKTNDGDDVAEPINLKLNGDKGGDNETTITWRHLEEKPYAALIT